MGDEHRNEENEEFIKNPPEENNINKSKNCEGITEEDVIIILSAQRKTCKVIKAVILFIDT